MKKACIDAVNQAAGRALRDSEIKAIDDRINATMRRLAREDEDWQSKPTSQRVMEASVAAMQELQAEAARKIANVQRQALATAATNSRIGEQKALMGSTYSRAFVEDINHTSFYADGIKRETMGRLAALIDGAKSGEGAGVGQRVMMFLLDAENPKMSRDLVSEVFANADGRSGNKLAQKGAKAWLQTIEELRQRFNAAGGAVRRLDYGYLPQAHDSMRVRNAGAQAWVDKTFPLLDRTRYLREDGSRMSDQEVTDFLREAYTTVATEGINKMEPGQFRGAGATANRGNEARQIHFKDGESYLSYMAEFGKGSMYDAMLGHVGAMARDIAFVERYGPNPNSQFLLQKDTALLTDGAQGTLKSWWNDKVLGPEAMWNLANGNTGTPQNPSLAKIGQDARNIQTFGKLAGALISSITDLGTVFVSTGYNKLSYFDVLKNIARQPSKQTKEFLTSHGVIADSLISDLNRWAGEHLDKNLTGRLANSTMKLSLMNAWTDSLRKGFAMTMMQGLAKLSKKKWGELTEWDRTHLQRKGITEQDWEVVTQAQVTEFQGGAFLTPEAIRASGSDRANEVVAKVLGFITDESEYAVINPDLTTRAIQTWGQQAGTGAGEFARMTMQFKSFPIAMISRHWRRMLDADRTLEGAPAMANPLVYGAALFLTTTALGAIAFQAKQMVQGKDPVDMTTGKFWTRAVAQGGGAGFLGDILLGDTTDDRSPLDSLSRLTMGPTFGSAADLWELTKGNVDEWRAGRDTHIGAEALRFGRSHAPYVNLWYGRAALDHLLIHGVQENLSPGYLNRQRQRHMKEWGGTYWWEPGAEFGDMRAPDLMQAVGQ